MRPVVIVAVIVVRYILMPVCGIGIVKAANHLGFLPEDPLYHFVLLTQFVLPPAMSIGIKLTKTKYNGVFEFRFCTFVLSKGYVTMFWNFVGTMTQLFDVAQEECSVLFLWTYVVAVFFLTIWSTIFLWILV